MLAIAGSIGDKGIGDLAITTLIRAKEPMRRVPRTLTPAHFVDLGQASPRICKETETGRDRCD